MDVRETKNMDLFNKVHIFGLMKVHTYVPNISLIRLFSLMLNYAKPRLFMNIHYSLQLERRHLDHRWNNSQRSRYGILI